jgi:tripartite-type tricarboxylate transporter receptor subunit TctC
MKISSGLRWSVAVLAVIAALPAVGQTYPSKPIRWIIPFAAGGGTDILSRAYAPALQSALGQPVVVENRPSNAAIIGADAVAKSPADGYTLLTGGNEMVFNMLLYRKLPYDTLRDFAPVALIAKAPAVLFVHESVPAKTLGEFVTHARKLPGQLNYGSGGVGHPFHLAMELFQQRTGTKLLHVPYKGFALVIQDFFGGRLEAIFYPATAQLTSQVKAGKIRALAAATEQRLSVLPDVPTFKEAGIPDFDPAGWFGLFAPAGTPRNVVERLNREMLRAGTAPEIQKSYEQLSMLRVPLSADQFAQMIRSDLQIWDAAIKPLGITLD